MNPWQEVIWRQEILRDIRRRQGARERWMAGAVREGSIEAWEERIEMVTTADGTVVPTPMPFRAIPCEIWRVPIRLKRASGESVGGVGCIFGLSPVYFPVRGLPASISTKLMSG